MSNFSQKFHQEKIKRQSSLCQVQCTSGLNKRKGAPIDLISDDSCDGDSDIFNDDDESFAVCVRGGSQCNAFVIAKWAKCDYCPHWTHLIYCPEVRFVRLREEFRCPHCLTKTINSPTLRKRKL